MQDENGLPSQQDLDAVNAELMAEANTAPAAVTREELPAAPVSDDSIKSEVVNLLLEDFGKDFPKLQSGLASEAKAAHDAVIGDLTAQLPDIGTGPDAEAAIAYVEGKGFSRAYAENLVKKNGVDVVLQAKATEDTAKRPPINLPKAGETLSGESQRLTVSRHGEVFNPEIHAQLPTGDPKTDSTGKFIMKAHDYAGPKPNAQFPD